MKIIQIHQQKKKEVYADTPTKNQFYIDIKEK